MKTCRKFLESICKRVRRTQRNASRRSRSEKEDTSKPVSSNSRHQTKAKDINSVVEQCISVSLNPEVARGDFRDSSPSMAAAESVSRLSSRSLPSRIDSSDITSSAPLLHVHLAGESSLAAEVQAISTANQECLESDTSPPAHVATAGDQKSEGQCMLSATDSGLYSEEEDSIEEEFLEVFSDQEEEDGGMEEGWLIPAEEVSLDKVVTATGRETVYR